MPKLNNKQLKILIIQVALATLSLGLVEKHPAVAAYIAGGGCSNFSATCDRVEFKVDGKLFYADFVEDSFTNLKSQYPNAFPFFNDFDKTQQAELSIINMLNDADPVPTDLAIASSSGQIFRRSVFWFPLGVPEPGGVLNEYIYYGFPPGTPPNVIPEQWTVGRALPTGEDAITVYPLIQEVPEPLTILGLATALGGGVVLKKEYAKRLIGRKA
ncbi:MAG: PEP-CTERM sorting domain-containing protein [Acaryochloris sp. RU_4_1]|nr:PEP-CTERM sorting domain-containing protein [Acaryochloris sp. RU_4_1]NJR56159.1 PEP-CTERM sorting domain-containing protein [Acaryochloris sp. CRU_2_0]